MKLRTEVGKNQEYIVDKKLITGLHLTQNLTNVKKNLKNFKIKVEIGSMKITTIDNYSILTVVDSSFNKKQFLVTDDLNYEELAMLPEITIENEFKQFLILSKRSIGFLNL